MRKKKFWFLVSLVLVLVFSRISFSKEIMSVSVSNLQTNKEDRVLGFEVKIRSGTICSLLKVPSMWELKIRNYLNDEPGWNTHLKGTATVGAAAPYLDFFHDFLLIEKDAGEWAGKLDIQVTITTSKDFETQKVTTFQMKDLTLKSVHLAPCIAKEEER